MRTQRTRPRSAGPPAKFAWSATTRLIATTIVTSSLGAHAGIARRVIQRRSVSARRSDAANTKWRYTAGSPAKNWRKRKTTNGLYKLEAMMARMQCSLAPISSCAQIHLLRRPRWPAQGRRIQAAMAHMCTSLFISIPSSEVEPWATPRAEAWLSKHFLRSQSR